MVTHGPVTRAARQVRTQTEALWIFSSLHSYFYSLQVSNILCLSAIQNRQALLFSESRTEESAVTLRLYRSRWLAF
jgi:hypothetical protein